MSEPKHGFQVLRHGSADREFLGAVFQSAEISAAEPADNLLHLFRIHNRAAVDSDEALWVKLVL